MRIGPPRTLRGRLALAATLSSVAVLGIVGLAIVATFAARERDVLDRDLEARADRLLRTSGELGRPRHGGRYPDGPREPLERLLGGPGVQVRLVADDKVLFDNGALSAEVPVATEPGFESFEVDGESYRSYTRLIGQGATVQVAASQQAVDDRIGRVTRLALLAVAVGALITAFVARALAGLALRPLASLRAGAASVSGTQDLTARLPVEGPEEVDDLARSLNAMLERLESSAGRTEAALQAARRFTADAGHELRTPLTSLAANLDVLFRQADLPPAERERVMRALTADQARLVTLLDGLQALARGDAGVGARAQEVDLTEVADAALASASARHPDVRFEFAGADSLWAGDAAPLVVRGDEAGLRAILDNLLENAARHGGRTARLSLAARDGQVTITVDDDGPGIPAAERARVFERFARGASVSGPGSGLGLAIAAQQARLHGGDISISDAPLGGARFSVELPAGTAPP